VTPSQQKVRVWLLVVLTGVVVGVGAVVYVLQLRQERQRVAIGEGRLKVKAYVMETLRQEQAAMADLAQAHRGALSRDAAALLAQADYLVAMEPRASWTPGSTRAPTAFQQIMANFQRLKMGSPAEFPQAEPFLRAYYDPIDGAIRPYGVCVPEAYSPETPHPLVVAVAEQPGEVAWDSLRAPYYRGAVSVKLAVPLGRESYDPAHAVMSALSEVVEIYNVDPSRVYLIGHGTGADACWYVATHYPHRFAALIAVGGPASLAPDSTGVPLQSAAGLARFVRMMASPGTLVENLTHCRVIAADLKPLAGSAQGRETAGDRLREAGGDFETLAFPQAGASGLPEWVEQYALAKAFGAPPGEVPSAFTYRTEHVRYGRAWWVDVSVLERPLEVATVEATLEDGVARLSTRNVAALAVLPDRTPGPLTRVQMDGMSFPATGTTDMLRFHRDGSRWAPGPCAAPCKRDGLAGPLGDVLRAPFAVVYGTAEATPGVASSRREAEAFAADWERVHAQRPRLLADSEVGPGETRRLNLLLFGSPAANTVTARVAESLPVDLTENAVAIGDRRYSGQGIGLLMCYPNPLDPSRMVALVAGTVPSAQFQAWNRLSLWPSAATYAQRRWFDFAVFDHLTAGLDSAVAVGFFGANWELPGEGAGLVWERDEAAAEGMVPQGTPALTSAVEAETVAVTLSDVEPMQVDQPAGAVGFDRSFLGRPIVLGEDYFDTGLGVAPPSHVCFALDGRFTSFRALVGCNGPKRRPEQAVFEVLGDGRTLASVRASPEAGATPVDADVDGVHVLELRCVLASGRPGPDADCAWATPIVCR
jgi:pimeloyl-ACP methyl ester carboxylesterase